MKLVTLPWLTSPSAPALEAVQIAINIEQINTVAPLLENNRRSVLTMKGEESVYIIDFPFGDLLDILNENIK